MYTKYFVNFNSSFWSLACSRSGRSWKVVAYSYIISFCSIDNPLVACWLMVVVQAKICFYLVKIFSEPHLGATAVEERMEKGNLVCQQSHKYPTPESRMTLSQPLGVERPQDTWIRCCLPSLSGTGALCSDNIECELTSQPLKFPRKSPITYQVVPRVVCRQKCLLHFAVSDDYNTTVKDFYLSMAELSSPATGLGSCPCGKSPF